MANFRGYREASCRSILVLSCCFSVSSSLEVAPRRGAVPGLFTSASEEKSLFGRGYDPTRAEPKQNIFEYHYFENKTWACPWDDAAAYSLPDEVEIFNIPSTFEDLEASDAGGSNTYFQFEEKKHYSGLFLVVYNSISIDASAYVNWAVNKTDHLIAQAINNIGLFRAVVPPPSVLRDDLSPGGSQARSSFALKQYLLPASRETEDDIFAYQSFLDTFGTHYVAAATFGGQLQGLATVNHGIATQVEATLSAQLNAAFIICFARFTLADMGVTVSEDVSAQLAANMAIELVAYGGDPVKVLTRDWDSWHTSIKESPVPINVTYANVSELIYDPMKRQLMRDAVDEYLTAAAPGEANSGAYGTCISSPGGNFTWSEVPTGAPIKRTPLDQFSEWADARGPAVVLDLAGSHAGWGYDVRQGAAVTQISGDIASGRQRWENVATGVQFLIPDGFIFMQTPTACLRGSLQAFTEADEVASFNADAHLAHVGLKIKGTKIKVKGTFLELQADFNVQLDEWAKAVVFANVWVELFEIMYVGGHRSQGELKLKAAIERLPNKSAPEYNKFINEFGTHFTQSTIFGASCNVSAVIDQDLAKEAGFDLEYQMAQAKIKIRTVLGSQQFGLNESMIQTELDTGNSTEDPAFDSFVNISHQCIGGDDAKLGNLNDWFATISSNPVPLDQQQKLRPISDLISDPVKKCIMENTLADMFGDPQNKTALRNDKQVNPSRSDDSLSTSEENNIRGSIKGKEKNRQRPRSTSVPTVPGVCDGLGGVGVGCGFDATKVDVYGLSVTPKRSVLNFDFYDPDLCAACFENPSDQECYSGDCCYQAPAPHQYGDECAAYNIDDAWFQVPKGIDIMDYSMYTGCFTESNYDNYSSYEHSVYQYYSHKSWFHSSSHAQMDYMKNYYGQDASMSLSWKSMTSHAVRLQPGISPTPHQSFTRAVELLPLEYDGTSYRDFIDEFGTHFISEAYMGGTALQTAYYDSCLLYECEGEWVSDQSSSSFIITYSKDSDKWGYTNTTQLWESSSSVKIQLLGGDGASYGQPGTATNTTMNNSETTDWESSIFPKKQVPVSFTLSPITDLIFDEVIIANINQALEDYGAEIDATNEALTDDFMAHDPWSQDSYNMSSWCTCASQNPHCTTNMCCTSGGAKDFLYAPGIDNDPLSCDGPVSSGLNDPPTCPF